MAAVVRLTDRACLHHSPKVYLHRLEMSSWGCADRASAESWAWGSPKLGVMSIAFKLEKEELPLC